MQKQTCIILRICLVQGVWFIYTFLHFQRLHPHNTHGILCDVTWEDKSIEKRTSKSVVHQFATWIPQVANHND